MNPPSRFDRLQTDVEWSGRSKSWIVSALHCHEWTLVGVFRRVQDALRAAERASRQLDERDRPQLPSTNGCGI